MRRQHSAVSMSSSMAYRIRVQGVLGADWSDFVRGMNVSFETPPGGAPVTTLKGECLDQSALLGVLSALSNLGLPVLSVESLGTTCAATNEPD